MGAVDLAALADLSRIDQSLLAEVVYTSLALAVILSIFGWRGILEVNQVRAIESLLAEVAPDGDFSGGIGAASILFTVQASRYAEST